MFIRTIQLVVALSMFAIGNAIALDCLPVGQPDQLEKYQHVFMAELTRKSISYKDAPDGSITKTTIGHLVPIDVIKGQPEEVPYLEFTEGPSIPREYGGNLIAPEYAYMVFSSQDGPIELRGCFPVRIVQKAEAECVTYRFRQEADLSPDPNPECDTWIEAQLKAEILGEQRAQEIRDKIQFRKQEIERISREYSTGEDDT